MKKFFIVIILILLLLLFFVIFKQFFYTEKEQKQINKKPYLQATTMHLSSPVFQPNQPIPNKYTCNGKNTNPPLTIENVPANAKSLTVIVDDPDAPMGTWVHWVVYNIDPQIKQIQENSIPQSGIQGVTSFGKPGYGGPCPPSGTHHYHFKLYALDTELPGLQNPDKAAVEKAMEGHVIQKAELIGLYSKQ